MKPTAYFDIKGFFGVVKTSLSAWQVLGSIPEHIKSGTVANGSPLPRCFRVAMTLSRGDGLVTCYKLRRNTASIMKI